MWNSIVYKSINLFKTPTALHLANRLTLLPAHTLIIDNLYLGNLLGATDLEFLQRERIQAVVNCTTDQEFHPYFNNKAQIRIPVEDSRDSENLHKFRDLLYNAVDFIEREIEQGHPVYVHCYWGLMRSATVVAAYLIKKYQYTPGEATAFIKQKRPQALSALYNYNDLLEDFYRNHCLV